MLHQAGTIHLRSGEPDTEPFFKTRAFRDFRNLDSSRAVSSNCLLVKHV
jgi:hypothetical protein